MVVRMLGDHGEELGEGAGAFEGRERGLGHRRGERETVC